MKAVNTMLSLIITLSLFLLGTTVYTGGPQTIVPEKKPAIVFDLGGVLFETSRSSFLIKQLGRNVLPYILLHGSKMHIKNRWFETLDQVAREHTPAALLDHDDTPMILRDDAGDMLPWYMVEWICSLRSNQAIYREVKTGIKTHPEWFGLLEQRLMLNMTRAVFKPERFASTRKLIKPTIKLIKKLKKQGYPLYILSNWDAETFALMKERFPEIYALFDGIMISGEVHTAKPTTAIFELFRTTYPHDRYCLIDDQQDNIEAAQTCGWFGIKVTSTKPDIKEIKKQISAFSHA